MKDKFNLKLHIPYVDAVNAYMDKFYRKHGFDGNDMFWVADCVGTVCSIGDYFFSFEDIKYDIDNRVNKDRIIEWYDYCLENQNITYKINYKSYLMGARHEKRRKKIK